MRPAIAGGSYGSNPKCGGDTIGKDKTVALGIEQSGVDVPRAGSQRGV